ncbi:endonuclease III [uncultured Faecalibaculum sp.]|uniref:endonuclease III n=1 Tax=uncultured Faecalibaculum sp. TaxID=1729681 RepID=UPI002637B650|nr:endonuclease III [uncultured Faecalibaculum sp.]
MSAGKSSWTGDEIIRELETIFPDAECELHHDTPFQLLVAVVLSAQTTDAAVNRVTPALFAAYPDAASMAAASPAQLEPYIQSIGLYRTKAKNIAALARDLEELHGGQVPSSRKELESLPGVGRKTANVVRSVAFGIPSFAVDTHVDRISKRLGLAKPQDQVEKVEEKLKRKISRELWNRGHHEMIFFGRYFCTARNPRCTECPFTAICRKEKLEAWKTQQKKNARTASTKD